MPNDAGAAGKTGTGKRALTLLAGVVAAATAVLGTAPANPVDAQSPPPPHWGPYRWSGGAERADVRAFWLIDRTGNAQMNDIIRLVADSWNSIRNSRPEMPYVAVLKDDANAGKCFVNQTPGYSVATACMFPANIEGVKGLASRNPDAQGHLIGAAMAVSEGLTSEEALTVVCHTFGHIMGLENSQDSQSCMSHNFQPGVTKWYTQADASYILGVYAHSDTGTTSTTSTSSSTSTSSPSSTTSTSTPTSSTTTSSTSTTVTSSTTTSTSTPLITTTSITLPVDLSTTSTTTGGTP